MLPTEGQRMNSPEFSVIVSLQDEKMSAVGRTSTLNKDFHCEQKPRYNSL